MILITGTNGRLGKEFKLTLRFSPLENLCLCEKKETFDITNENMMEDYILKNNVKVIINCAGHTKTNLIETKDIFDSFNVNAMALKKLGGIANKYNIKVIHFSTHYVFPSKDSPYTVTEFTEPSPKTLYGQFKYIGEQLLLETCPKATIIRLSNLVTNNDDNNLISKLKDMVGEKCEYEITNDNSILLSPAHAIVDFVLTNLFELDDNIIHFNYSSPVTPVELFNYINEKMTSEYDRNNSKVIPVNEFRPYIVKNVILDSKLYYKYNNLCLYWQDIVDEIL